MWTDNETDIDLLNIKHYVSSITSIVNDKTLLPVTVGIFGDWGNGKSSLLKMVKKELDKEKNSLCLYFNGWLFEDYDDAKSALIGSILDEINKRPNLTAKAKRTISKLKQKVNWFGLMGVAGKYGLNYLLGGPALGLGSMSLDLIKSVASKVKDGGMNDVKKIFKQTTPESTQIRKNIHEFKSDFSQLLKESKINNLVVIIDDLDRCLPDTILNTLEAIKLFISTENTAFLNSIDEPIIKYAINSRYPNFDTTQKKEISRDYLEKLIQIPIRVPLMSRNDMKSYINLLFASKHLNQQQFTELLGKVETARQGANFNAPIDTSWFAKNVVPLSEALKEELMITQQINDLLYDFLKGNPRQVKRFINALLLRINLAKLRGVDLKKQVLAKLMSLEYKQAEFFRSLDDWQSQQHGIPKQIEELETIVKTNSKNATDSQLKLWYEDKWIEKWLKSEPSLSKENLESYFYVSRDSGSYLSAPVIELSTEEQEIFDKLISSSAAHQKKGIELFEKQELNSALNITRLLIDKISKFDNSSNNGDYIKILTSLGNIKIELINDIVDCLSSVSDMVIPPVVVPELKAAKEKTTSDVKNKIDQLLIKFESSSNLLLSKAVKS